jgi:hypothetical protein
MPKATVNEYDHPLCWKGEVAPAPRQAGQRLIDAVPEPPGMEDSP